MKHFLILKRENFMISMEKKVLEMEVVNLKDLEIYLICLEWAAADKKVRDPRKSSHKPNKSKSL
jgi:hypothetical protein